MKNSKWAKVSRSYFKLFNVCIVGMFFASQAIAGKPASQKELQAKRDAALAKHRGNDETIAGLDKQSKEIDRQIWDFLNERHPDLKKAYEGKKWNVMYDLRWKKEQKYKSDEEFIALLSHLAATTETLDEELAKIDEGYREAREAYNVALAKTPISDAELAKVRGAALARNRDNNETIVGLVKKSKAIDKQIWDFLNERHPDLKKAYEAKNWKIMYDLRWKKEKIHNDNPAFKKIKDELNKITKTLDDELARVDKSYRLAQERAKLSSNN